MNVLGHEKMKRIGALAVIFMLHLAIALPFVEAADPGHSAAAVGSGTFESGDYGFPGSLNITASLGVGSRWPGGTGNINASGNISIGGLFFSRGAGNNYFAGNLGIGTAAAASKLTVIGNGNITGGLNVTGSIKSISGIFYGDGSGLTNLPAGSVQDVWVNESGDTMTGNLIINANLTVDSGVLFVDNYGNYVGIGTTRPDELFELSSSSFSNTDMKLTATANGAVGGSKVGNVMFEGQDTSVGTAVLSQISGIYVEGASGGDGFAIDGSSGDGGGIAFLTNKYTGSWDGLSEAMRIDMNGYVGIGTGRPTQLLDVRGNIYTTGNIAVNGDHITSDGNLEIEATGYVRIGDDGSPGSANGDDDLYVRGSIEADGIFYGDGSGLTNLPSGAVADVWVNESGDTMTGNLVFSSANLDMGGGIINLSGGYIYDSTGAATVNDDLKVNGGDITGANSITMDLGEADTDAVVITTDNVGDYDDPDLVINSGGEGNIRLGAADADTGFQIYTDSASFPHALKVRAELNPDAADYEMFVVMSSGAAERFSVIHGVTGYGSQFYDSLAVGAAGDNSPTLTHIDFGTDSSGDLWVGDDAEINGEMHIDGTGTSTMDGDLQVADDSWIGIGSGSERVVFDSAGDIEVLGANVGIGTTVASAYLHIEDLLSSGDLLELTTDNKDIDIRIGENDDGGYGYYWRYVGTQGGNDNELELWTEGQAGADVQVYEIEQDGQVNFLQNVGLGTDSPAYRLDVVDSIRAGTGSPGTADMSTGANADLFVTDDLEVDGIIYGDGSGLTNLPAGAVADIWINESGDTTGALTKDLNIDAGTLVVDYDANAVGIGTSVATGKLTITGPTANTGVDSNSELVIYGAHPQIKLRDTDGVGESWWIHANDAGLYFLKNDDESSTSTWDSTRPFFIGESGNVGIGTAAPSALLDVQGDAYLTGDILMTDGNYIGISGNERIVFDDAGDIEILGANVGIGTTAAETTLHVEGNMTIGGTGLLFEDSTSGGDASLTRVIRFNNNDDLRYDDTNNIYTFTGDAKTYLVMDDQSVGIARAPSYGLDVINSTRIGDGTPGTADMKGKSAADLYVTDDIEFDGVIYGDGSGLTNLPAGAVQDIWINESGDTTGALVKDLNIDANTLLVDYDANSVGIGTSAASQGRLHVYRSDTIGGVGGTLTNAALAISNGANDGFYIDENEFHQSGDNFNLYLDTDAKNFIFYDNAGQIMTIQDGGNVGIGTATATQKLDVQGNAYITGDILMTDGNYIGISGNERIVFDTAGDIEILGASVGIGTTVATAPLEIAASADEQLLIEGGWDDTLTSNARMNFNDENFGVGAGQYGGGSSEDAMVLWSYKGAGRGILFASTAAGDTTTFQSMTHNMFIDGNTGAVGIAKTSPSYTLDVSNSTRIGTGTPGTVDMKGGPDADLYVTNDIEFDGVIYGDGSGLVNLPAGAVQDIWINESGDTTGALTKDLNIDADTFVISYDDNRVGIGTAAPTQLLDVEGNLEVDGTLYFDAANADGTIDMDGYRIEDLGDPDSGDDAMDRDYADSRYVNTNGDTMTGTLTTRQVTVQDGYVIRHQEQGGNAIMFDCDGTDCDSRITIHDGQGNFNIKTGVDDGELFIAGGSHGAAKYTQYASGADGAHIFQVDDQGTGGAAVSYDGGLRFDDSGLFITTSPGDHFATGGNQIADLSGHLYTEAYLYHEGDTNTYVGFPSNDEIRLRTSGTDRITIVSGGNVGIGTATPSQLLDVRGNIYTTGDIAVNGDDITSDSNLDISATGYVRIGDDTGTPNYASGDDDLYVYGDIEADGVFYGDGSGLINLPAGAVQDIWINESGDTTGALIKDLNIDANTFVISYDDDLVGIGTATPATKLDVEGDIQLSGQLLGDVQRGGETTYSSVGYWTFDGDYDDYSGYGQTGTARNNAARTSTNALFGQSLSLDGTDDSIEIADSGSSPLDVTNAFTFEAWVRPDLNTDEMILNKETSYEWVIQGSGTVQWALYTSGTWEWHDTGVSVPTLEWTHLALTYDGTNVRVYKNGELKSTIADPDGGAIGTNDNNLCIGTRGGDGCAGTQDYDGLIDEVRIYNRVLTSEEIRAHHTQSYWAEEGSNVYLTSSGNVGIGTATATQKLDVRGNAYITGDVLMTDDNYIGISGAERLVFDTAGDLEILGANLGIGTSTTNANLDIYGGGSATTQIFIQNPGNNGAGKGAIDVNNGDIIGLNKIFFDDLGEGLVWATANTAATSKTQIYSTDATPSNIYLDTNLNSNAGHVIIPSGNVGIGTVTPAQKLDVRGNIYTTGDIAVNGDDITSDGNLLIAATGYVRVGDTGTPTYASGDDDLYVYGDIEADGVFYGDGSGLVNLPAGAVDDIWINESGDTTGALTKDLNIDADTFVISYDDNLVGIGTATPSQKLDVVGNVEINGKFGAATGSSDGQTRGFWVWNLGDSNHVIYSAASTGTSPAGAGAADGLWDAGHRMRFRTATTQGFLFENNGETALVDIDSDNGNLRSIGTAYFSGSGNNYFAGNIGIGTATPSQLLDVRGNIYTTGDIAVNGDDITSDSNLDISATGYVRIGDDTGTPNYANADDDLYVYGDIEADGVFYGDGSGLVNLPAGAVDDIWINESGDTTGALTKDLNIDADTLVISYDDNLVGIGTASPSDALHVHKDSGIRISDPNNVYRANLLFGADSAWNSGIRVYDNGDAEMRIWHENVDGQIILATGYAGDMATTIPGDGLFIHENKLGIGYGATTIPDGARLAVNGNTGIGTASPTQLLDVRGNIYASGNVDVDGTLYFDAANADGQLDMDGQTIQMRGGVIEDATDEVDINDNLAVAGQITANYFKAGQGNSATIGSVGWYRIASNGGNRANAEFTLRDYISGGGHSMLTFKVGVSYDWEPGMSFTLLNHNYYSTATFTKVRVWESSYTYDPMYVEVYVARTGSMDYSIYDNLQSSGWSPIDWTAGATPTGTGAYTAREFEVNNLFTVGDYDDRFTVARGGNVGIGSTSPSQKLHVQGNIYASGNVDVDGTLYFDAGNADGTLDMDNQVITNIGDAGTDFTSGGHLTLAGDLAVNGDDITSDSNLDISATGYVRIGDDTGTPTYANGDDDLYVYGDIEADGVFYGDGSGLVNLPAGAVDDIWINESGDTTGALTKDLNIDADTFVISYDDNRVGIGTAAPGASLDVYGTATDHYFRLGSGAAGANSWDFVTSGTGSTFVPAGSFWLSKAGTGNVLTVDTSGNVGIGTNTPTQLLDVEGDMTLEGDILMTDGDYIGISGNERIVFDGAGDLEILGASVGIGTTVASDTLDVRGDAVIGDGTTYGDTRFAIAGTNGNNDGTFLTVKRDGTTNPVYSMLPWDSQIYLSAGIYYSNGAWVHNSDDTNNLLFVLDPGAGTAWYASNNGAGSWNVASNEALWDAGANWKNLVQSTQSGVSYFTGGNVGIGTATPSQLLDVRGNIYTTGDIAVNGDDITSDGNLLIAATGYVRIGDTGTPNYANADDDLYVYGDIEADGIFYGDGSGLVNLPAGAVQDIWINESGDTTGALTKDLNIDADTLVVDYDANSVGIGTATPGYKLEVAGTAKSGAAAVSAANQPALRIAAANTAATGRITAIQQLTTEGDTRIFADYDPYVEYGMYARNSDDSIHFTAGTSTNGLESWTEYNTAGAARTAYSKMKVSLGNGQVTIGGNVGIGTATATQKLDVRGNIYASGNVDVDGTLYFDAANADGTLDMDGQTIQMRGGVIEDATDEVDINDDVAITGNVLMADDKYIGISGAERIVFDTAGDIEVQGANLGIGTATASQALYVVGQHIYTTGTLVDDGNGKNLIPNWQMESDTYWADPPEQTAIADFEGVTHYAHQATESGTGCYQWAQTGSIPADASKTYKFTVWIKSTGTDMNNYFGFYIFDSAGTRITGSWDNPYFKTSESDPNSWIKWTAYLGPSYAGGATGCDTSKTNADDWCMSSSTAYIRMRFGSCYADGSGTSYSYFIYPSIEEVNPDDSYTVGNHVFMSGNVGIGSTSPSQRLHVQGNIYASGNVDVDGTLYFDAGNADGTLDMDNQVITNIGDAGTDFTSGGHLTLAGDLAVNGDDITSDSNLDISATGYVRIGDTASPGIANGDDDLYVEGDIEADGVFYGDGSGLVNLPAGAVQDIWINESGDTTGALTKDLNIDADTFVISYDDNRVGIGTAAPGAPLHVRLAAGGETVRIDGGTSYPRLYFDSGHASVLAVINRQTGDEAKNLYFGETADTGQYIFRTSGATTFEGNVGIGTGTPTQKLDVRGNIYASGNVDVDGTLYFDAANADGQLDMDGQTIQMRGGVIEDATDEVDINDDVAITGDILLADGNYIGISGAERIVFDDAGDLEILGANVGIGTTVAGEALDVRGNIRAYGRIDAGLYEEPIPGIGYGNTAMPSSGITYTDTGVNLPSTAFRGVVWTGKHYLFTDYVNDRVYFYDQNFNQIQNKYGNTYVTLPSDPVNPHGAAWDGRYLWMIEYPGSSNFLVAYDLDGSSVVRVARCDVAGTAAYGVGYAEGLLYYLQSGTLYGYRWNGGDSCTQVMTATGFGTISAQAITYDGSYLWITQNSNTIYKANLDGDIISTIAWGSGQPPEITGWTWNGKNIVAFEYSAMDIDIIHTTQEIMLTGAVGIGTSSALERIDARDGQYIFDDRLCIGNSGTACSDIGSGTAGVWYGDDAADDFFVGMHTANSKFGWYRGGWLGTIDGGGNMGIGTETPAQKLDVRGNIYTTGDIAVNGDDITSDGNLLIAATGYVRIGDTGTPNYANGDDDLYVYGDIEADGIIYGDGSGIFNIDADSIEDIWINEAGDTTGALTEDLNIDANTFVISYDDNLVGIGTATPGYKLEVDGTFNADVGNAAETTIFEHSGVGTPVPFNIRKTGYSGSSQSFGVLHLDMGHSVAGGGSNLHFRLKDSAGNYDEYGGIGAYIVDSTTTSEDGNLAFYTTAAGTTRQQRMTIQYGGNVGIGTAAPGAKLHVAGDILATGLIAGSSAIADDNANLEIYWPLDGDTKDYSGHGYDGSLSGATFTSSGKVGGAYDFDAANEKIVYNPGDYAVADYTIEFWMKADTIPGGWRDMVSISGEAGRVHLESGDNSITWYGVDSLGSIDSGVIPTVGQWYHVAVTKQGTAAKIYVNGAEKNSATRGATTTFTYLQVGCDAEIFDGILDEVKYYRRTLSAPEIYQHYAAGVRLLEGDAYVRKGGDTMYGDLRVLQGGNVGIGTAVPTQLLDVEGDMTLEGDVLMTDGDYIGISGAERIVFDDAGDLEILGANVGIGTTAAGSTLDVRGDTVIGDGTAYGDTRFAIAGTNGNNDGTFLTVKRDGSTNPVYSILPWDTQVLLSAGTYYSNSAWVHNSDDTNSQIFVLDPGAGTRWYASSDSSGSWNVASDETLWDDAANWKNLVQSTQSGTSYFTGGNVGIGTAAPGGKLDVRGARVLLGSNTFAKAAAGQGDIMLDNGGTDTPGIHFYTAANDNFGIDVASGKLRFVYKLDESGGVSRMEMDSAGAVTATSFSGDGSGLTGVSAGRLLTSDTRATNPAPQTYSMGIISDFKGNAADGLSDGGSYHGVLIFRQWSSGSDWSGGGVRQVGFTDNHNLWIRGANADTTWSSWNRILDTDSTVKTSGVMQIDGTGNSYVLGNVGVGTASPSDSLHVYRNYDSAGSTTTNAATIFIDGAAGKDAWLGWGTAGTAKMVAGIDDGGNSVNFWGYNGAWNPGLAVTTGGYVGVGTTTPDSKMHVYGAGGTNPTSITGLYGNSIVLENTGGGTTGSTVGIFGAQSNNPGIVSGIGFGREDSGNWGSTIRFYTHPTATSNIQDITERMRITADGGVGIGTAGPATKLDVYGGIRQGGITPIGVGGESGGSAIDNDYTFGFQEAGSWVYPYPDLILGYHTGIKIGGYWNYNGVRFYNDHPLRAGATELFSVGNLDQNVRVTNDLYVGGNVGIGTGAPANKLDVWAGAGQARVYSSSDAPLKIQGSNTWSGISFQDSAASDEIWYWGGTDTFAIGGGGSTGPAGKKLHVDGAMTIGSHYDTTSMPTNGLRVEGAIMAGDEIMDSGSTDNLVDNGDFEQGEIGWGGITGISSTQYYAGGKSALFSGSLTMLSDDYIPVDPEYDTLHLEGWFKKTSGGGILYFGYIAYDQNKAVITTSPCGTYCYFAASGYGLPIDGNWHKFQSTTTGECTSFNCFPVGTRYVRVLGLINYAGSGDTYVDHVRLYKVSNGPLVVGDYASTTNRIDYKETSRIYTTSAGDLILYPKSDGQGEIGIGTASPTDALHIHRDSGLRISDPANPYRANILFGADTVWNSGIRVYDNGDAEMRIWHENANGRIILATGYAGDMATTMPSDGLFIDQNNLGIGVNPVTNLQVANNVATDALDTYPEYQIMLYDAGGPTNSYGLGIKPYTMAFNSDRDYDFDVDGVTKFTIENGDIIMRLG
ncbi:MAG: LamG domain-containing protein [archaeon]